MSIESLEELARAPSPAFRCIGAGRESRRTFYARLRHTLRPPATSNDIARAQEALGLAGSDIVAFCRRHDGFVLYQDALSETAGIEMLPIGRWPEATTEMRAWLEMLCAGDDPNHLGTGVAFEVVAPQHPIARNSLSNIVASAGDAMSGAFAPIRNEPRRDENAAGRTRLGARSPQPALHPAHRAFVEHHG
jgi:hypothetical protein